MTRGDRFHARERGLRSRVGVTQQLRQSLAPCAFRDGEHAADRSDPTVECQLADRCVLGEAIVWNLARGG